MYLTERLFVCSWLWNPPSCSTEWWNFCVLASPCINTFFHSLYSTVTLHLPQSFVFIYLLRTEVYVYFSNTLCIFVCAGCVFWYKLYSTHIDRRGFWLLYLVNCIQPLHKLSVSDLCLANSTMKCVHYQPCVSLSCRYVGAQTKINQV